MLGGIGGIAGTVVGFWFGGRRLSQDKKAKKSGQDKGQQPEAGGSAAAQAEFGAIRPGARQSPGEDQADAG